MSSDKADTRTRILKSTWGLLEESVGSNVRMSDIAKRAGVSRQAVYLHFPSRAELLIETTRYLDEVHDADARLAASRAATSGEERLSAFVSAWGSYIPEIYGVAKALIAMRSTDVEADQAWSGRMLALKEGCAAAVNALADDGILADELTPDTATDLLWTHLSVQNWAQLRHECGWSQTQYLEGTQHAVRRLLIG